MGRTLGKFTTVATLVEKLMICQIVQLFVCRYFEGIWFLA